MTNRIERKKYAVYDPATKLFATTNDEVVLKVIWTDKINSIKTYSIAANALDLLKAARQGSASLLYPSPAVPGAIMVEVTVSLEWEETDMGFTVEDTPAYKKFKADYEAFLPAFRADPDAMSSKDWNRFKAARMFLRENGYPVEK